MKINEVVVLCFVIAIAFYKLSYHNEKRVYSNRQYTNRVRVEPSPTPTPDERPKNIEKFFENYSFINSPLANMDKEIIQISDNYDLDYRLILSIAGVESTLCKAGQYIPETHNCFGYGPGIPFNSYKEGFEKVAKTLAFHYDTSSLESIGQKYNPGNWEDWSGKVAYFIRKIENKPYEGNSRSSTK